MSSEVQKELDRLSGEVRQKLGDHRVKPSAVTKAVEKVLELDTKEFKQVASNSIRRKLLGVVGDILIELVDMTFHGKGKVSSKASNVIRQVDNVSYRNYSKVPTQQTSGSVVKNKYTFSDLIFPTRVDAEDLKNFLRDTIIAEGKVSVTQLYDELDDPTNLEMTDANFGWYDVSGAYVTMEGNVYRLNLPAVVALNK